MKKTYYDYSDIEYSCLAIARQMAKDNWRPDYIVGLTRGGLLPAVLLSNWFDCPMETLKVQLRDGSEQESNLWMAEDAFGYINSEERGSSGTRWDPTRRKNILIVDDINDTGATLSWIKNDWQESCLPNEKSWETVWGKNVRVACLFNKVSSESTLEVDYSAVEITEDNNPGWIVFPWEAWCGE